ncbi:MAG: HEAT repeat domain-containing protein [Gemmatales bacterium]|nr:HEAT repeat domain-containing protein [Gemmatales bacterium]MCS7160140.1 HEAT repeat domain-containing protein [Gemmatales bacterium]MDW8175340.1 HEAT repeat domain-containing protein [Gemmatales bacterium]MDW8223151.1 HEAT repeat domain-containing protein [Gemmatales bacterium]
MLVRIILVALLTWLAVLGIGRAEPKAASLEELIRQLGDRDFRTRESAARLLLELGDKALPALEAGMREPDPEVRRRCKELHRQVLTLSLESKIKRFLATQGKDESAHLPGWQRFSNWVGADAEAQQFYAGLVRVGYELLDKVERASRSEDAELQRQAQEGFVRLCEGIFQTVFNNASGTAMAVAPESFALAIFLSGYPGNQGLQPQLRGQLYSLCYQQNIRQILTSQDASGRVLRRLVAAWVTHDRDANVHAQGMQLALAFDMPELAGAAKKLAENKQVAGYVRGQALSVVAKYGGKKEITFIERFLGDESNVTTFQVSKQNKPVLYKTEVRDWALVLLLHLTDQKLRDYPFPAFQAVNFGGHIDPIRTYMPHYFGFSEPQEREAVFQKWQQWRVDNPLP